MRSKAFLWLSLLLALVTSIAVSYSPGHAQQGPSTVRVREVSSALNGAPGTIGVPVEGRIIGFSCVHDPGPRTGTRCYVATTD